MNFDLTQEQQMLRDSIEKFMQNDYDFETRRQLANSQKGFSLENWSQFAKLGWLSVPFAEDHGGFGGNTIDTMLIMEAFGKALVVEPWVATVVLSGRLIEKLGTDHQRESCLTPIMQGEQIFSLAYLERQARFNPACCATRADKQGAGYVINGAKVAVLHGQNADQLLVSARSAGGERDRNGIGVFIVDAQSPGIEIKGYKTLEGGRAAEIVFHNVSVPKQALLGDDPLNAFDALESVIDEAIIAVGAEAVGAMEVLYKTTVEYAKTRQQFGVPIGKFQALQHRMADMFIAHEQCRSGMYMAALRFLEGGDIARKAVSLFKIKVGKAGRHIGQEAIQLHGGIGMTDELNVGYYFKRLTCIDALLGDVDYHLYRCSQLQ